MTSLKILSGGAAQGLVASLAPTFKDQTGLDIEGEQPGILPAQVPKSGIGMMTSFGDGISLTPLELAALMGAVANGGTLYYLQYPKTQLEAQGLLPRVKPSTKGEGYERRYFYGAVWASCVAQPALGILWKTLPRSHAADLIELVVFSALLALMAWLAQRGVLPRTRPIVPGELAISD